MFQQQFGQPGFTKAQINEQNYPIRVKVLKCIFWMSIILMPFGVLSVVFGIVLLVNLEESSFPLDSGCQIWTGAVMFSFGILGYLTARTPANLKEDIPVKMKYLFGAFYGLAVGSLSVSGIGLGYSIGGATQCSSNTECLHGTTVVMVMAVMCAPMFVCYFVCAVIGMGLFIKYRLAFQMYNSRERMACFLQQRVASLENQVEKLEGNQSTGYTYGGTGSYGTVNNGFTGSSPSVPPPPYSEKNKM